MEDPRRHRPVLEFTTRQDFLNFGKLEIIYIKCLISQSVRRQRLHCNVALARDLERGGIDLRGRQIVDQFNLAASPVWQLTARYLTRHGDVIRREEMTVILWRQMQAPFPIDWDMYTNGPPRSDYLLLSGPQGKLVISEVLSVILV